jgi:hypothetical protein
MSSYDEFSLLSSLILCPTTVDGTLFHENYNEFTKEQKTLEFHSESNMCIDGLYTYCSQKTFNSSKIIKIKLELPRLKRGQNTK